MRKDKVVYIHRNPKTLEIYYVGMGNTRRAYEFFNRNRYWLNYTNKYGKPIVDIVASNLTEEDAWDLEVLLIKEIGRKTTGEGILTNISKGGYISFPEHHRCRGGSHNKSKSVIHLDTGEVFETITSVMPYIDATHNHHVSSWLKEPREKDLRIRLIDKDNKIVWIPKFDGIYDSGYEELTSVDVICENYDYEADYEEEKLIKSVNLYKSEFSLIAQKAFDLSIFDELSISEVAEKIGLSRSKVHSYLVKSKQYIKDSVSNSSDPVKKPKTIMKEWVEEKREVSKDAIKDSLSKIKKESGRRSKIKKAPRRRRNINIAIRLSNEEHRKLKLRAEAEGKTISQLVRDLTV